MKLPNIKDLKDKVRKLVGKKKVIDMTDESLKACALALKELQNSSELLGKHARDLKKLYKNNEKTYLKWSDSADGSDEKLEKKMQDLQKKQSQLVKDIGAEFGIVSKNFYELVDVLDKAENESKDNAEESKS